MKKDQIRLGPETPSGQRSTIRRRGDEISTGVFGGLKEGQPIPKGAELISLGEPDSDGWHDVNVHYRHESEPAATPIETLEVQKRGTSDGPPQVATPAYRKGYDRIFGGKQKVGLA
jgi:hypothetical protein